jgi:uncharacterized protein (DUF488 family)
VTGSRAPLFTVGHGTSSQGELVALLSSAQVAAVVDIRRFPGSAAHPHMSRDAMAQWLPAAGIAYRWEPRLGGRRRLPKHAVTPDSWWTVEAFRAYAAHTRTEEFIAGLDELLQQASLCAVAVMCSETVWWRCHRRLVADVAVLGRGRPVIHLLASGPRPHQPAAGARPARDGLLIWDGAPAGRPGSAPARPSARWSERTMVSRHPAHDI